jgi:ComF family protein
MARDILEGLFPNHCALCGLRSGRSVPLCPDCEQDLQPNRCCCLRCAIPLPAAEENEALPRHCGSCLAVPPPFDRVIAPWLYDEYLAHLIHRWKYQREWRLTPLLASLWSQQTTAVDPVDLLIPVPLHWRRLLHRGFNQSDLLSRYLQRHDPRLAHSTLAPGFVRRRRATAAQSGMNAAQRAGNLRGAFTASEPCDNLRVAIIDDVLTTGATAAALARVLQRAGASHIEVWCLARTPAPAD